MEETDDNATEPQEPQKEDRPKKRTSNRKPPAVVRHAPADDSGGSTPSEQADADDDLDDDAEVADAAEEKPTDWRWLLKSFFKSKQRVFVGARLGVMLALLITTGWISVFAVTGFDPVERALTSPDPEDPNTWFRAPFFIVESGSMMHPGASFGRLGTIDPGDVVVIRKVEGREDIQTFYGAGDRKTGGGHGDVVVYVPAPTRENPFPQPVVHRAVAYLERNIIQIPNPNPSPGGSPTTSVPRFTVEEFGIYDARSVTIPELGLYNYQPDRSGFLTRGDNPRTNDLADQALGVTPHPIEENRVLGRVVQTVPYLGLARIALMGQNPAQLSPDHEWCTFLAGQAPCDNWVVFLAIVFVFVGVPFVITVGVFSHRVTRRWRERRRFEREQVQALARYEEERAERARQAASDEDGPAIPEHTALDLLSGKILPAGPPHSARRPAPPPSRTRIRYHDGHG